VLQQLLLHFDRRLLLAFSSSSPCPEEAALATETIAAEAEWDPAPWPCPARTPGCRTTR